VTPPSQVFSFESSPSRECPVSCFFPRPVRLILEMTVTKENVSLTFCTSVSRWTSETKFWYFFLDGFLQEGSFFSIPLPILTAVLAIGIAPFFSFFLGTHIIFFFTRAHPISTFRPKITSRRKFASVVSFRVFLVSWHFQGISDTSPFSTSEY